jgi:hypothetical protein
MFLAVLVVLVVLVNVLIWAWPRLRGRRGPAPEETDLAALQQGGGAAFGGGIGAAVARREGLNADEVKVREDTEPVKFRL